MARGDEQQNGLVLFWFGLVADTPMIFVCKRVCFCPLVVCFLLSCLLASRREHGRWQAAGRPKAMSEGCVTKEGGGCERPSSAGGSERGLGASLWGPSCWLAMEARPDLPSAIALPLSLSLSLRTLTYHPFLSVS